MSSEDYRRSQANQRTLATLMASLESVERGAPLRSGGVGAGGITVKGGSIRIEDGGNIEVSGEASFGGDTTVGGDMRITGTLSLPAGIIDNDALASPVLPAVASGYAEIGSLTLTPTVLVSASVPIPAGVTRALVMCIGTVSGNENEGLVQWIYSTARIRATGRADIRSVRSDMQLHEWQRGESTSHVTANLASLDGGTLTVDIEAYAGRNFTPWLSYAAVSAVITFLR